MEACKFFSSGGSTWGKSWRSEERGKIGRKAVSIDKEFCRAELKQKLSFYQLSSLCAKTTSRCLYLPERNRWNMRCTMHNPSTWSSQGGQKPGRHRLNTPAIGKNGEASMVLFLNISCHSFQDVARPMIGSAKKLKLSYRFASYREKIERHLENKLWQWGERRDANRCIRGVQWGVQVIFSLCLFSWFPWIATALKMS